MTSELTYVFSDNTLDFSAMDTFINHVLEALRSDGSKAITIFPRESYAVISYAEKLASEVVIPFTYYAS